MTNADRTWRERIESPGPEDDNIYKVPVEKLFERLEKNVFKLVKTVHGILVYGSPGIGKSFVVNKKLEELGYQKLTPESIDFETNCEPDLTDQKYYLVTSGPISFVELVRLLYKHKEKGQIIVFDDVDSIVKDSDAARVLRAIVTLRDPTRDEPRPVVVDGESFVEMSVVRPRDRAKVLEILHNINHGKLGKYNPEDLIVGGQPIYSKDGSFTGRRIWGQSVTTADGVPKVPDEFGYEGKIVLISNLSYTELEDAIRPRLYEFIESLDMTLTPTQVILRMKALIDGQVLGSTSVPQHIKYEILDVLISYLDDKTIDAYKLTMNDYLACEQKWLEFPDMDLKMELKSALVPK